VCAQGRLKEGGQHRHPVLAALGFAHDELAALERQILDPKP
jgi:hypothetical protein